jgi:hypothetical protein
MADCQDGLQRLQRSVVYASSGFKKTLDLRMNEVAVTVNSDTGLVHIDDSDDKLCIYIPRDPRDRRRCYTLGLPQALARFFKLQDSTASVMLQLVFVTAEDFLDDSLDAHGIVSLPANIPELSDTEVQDLSTSGTRVSDNSTEGRSASESQDTESFADDINTPLPGSETVEEVLGTRATHRRLLSLPPLFRDFLSPRVSLSRAPEPLVPESPYIQLLGEVIRLARQVTLREFLQRPQATVLGQGNISHELAFGVRSEGQIAHDIKIGAAGELFVRLKFTDYTCHLLQITNCYKLIAGI